MMVSHGSSLQLLLTTICLGYFQFVGATFSTQVLDAIRSKRATCAALQFKCKNDQCISKFSVCDGRADCSDKSDETPSLCLGRVCQSFSFQCAYGPCVNGHAKCNRVQDCVDNSDEKDCDYGNGNGSKPPTQQPSKPTTNKPGSKCRSNQFQCSSGKCISKFLLCDGKVDCQGDESDEDAARCKDTRCDTVYFRCAYGACVNSNAKCNGVKDCRDGSDEAPRLCGTNATTEAPESGKPQGCAVPNPGPGGQYVLSKCPLSDTSKCIAHTGKVLSVGSELTLRCFEDYSSPGTNTIACGGSSLQWIPSALPTCRRTCKPLVHPNLLIRCSLIEYPKGQKFERILDCTQPMFEKTIAIARCPEFFKEQGSRSLNCLSNGKWDADLPKCQHLCGYYEELAEPTIINGQLANHTNYPWHVGLYWSTLLDNGTYKFDYKCGGSLISPSTVLTAAHCGYDENHDQWVDPQNMFVALGKQKLTWEAAVENVTQRFSARDFRKKEGYTGSQSFHIHDYAVIILDTEVQITKFVFPVCLNFDDDRFGFGSVGKVPGWGSTGIQETSEELQYADIPYMPTEKCKSLLTKDERKYLTYDKFCGGTETPGPKTYKGDSGGGLIYKEGKLHYVVGIVSTTLKKDNFWVSFYSNVSTHSVWIRDNME